MSKTLMNTREVAEYLNIKERKVYDLVAQRQIPCTRAAGKWLFPRELVDLWLLQQAEGVPKMPARGEPPAIITGSHDPLLDWAIRESNCGLAVLFNGSLDGLERFIEQQALACGMHVLDGDSGQYNKPLIEQRLATLPVVLIEWAQRQQGLIVARDNPQGIQNLRDAVSKRFAIRQKEAGSYILLDYLLRREQLGLTDLRTASPPLRSETEVAVAIASGDADVGLGVAAVAHQLRLDFIPLMQERYDLLIWRRQYFEPPLQKLLAFVRSADFAGHARELAGYDISTAGTVHYNGF
jgi:excisionase family DNA binding protein